jgi:hypothetical protein
MKASFETLDETERETGLRPYLLPKNIRKQLGVNCATLEQFRNFRAEIEPFIRPLG